MDNDEKTDALLALLALIISVALFLVVLMWIVVKTIGGAM